MNGQQVAIGIDIGGTKIATGLVTSTGTVLVSHQVPTPVTEGPEAVLQTVIDQAATLREKVKDVEITAIGIGTAGMVNSEQGSIIHANPNLPGWTGMRLAERVSSAAKLPVYVDNDVNALAVGEGRFGAGTQLSEILYVAVGTGIGGAIVRNGQIWRGAHHGAGEIAYLVAGWDKDGNPIIIENCASGPAMTKQYCEFSQEQISLHVISERAYRGEALATQVIRDGAHILGHVLGPLIGVLDPEIVIIGGGVPNIGDLWWQPFVQVLRDSPLPVLSTVKIAPALLGTHAALVGAATIAFNEMEHT